MVNHFIKCLLEQIFLGKFFGGIMINNLSSKDRVRFQWISGQKIFILLSTRRSREKNNSNIAIFQGDLRKCVKTK